MSDLDPAAIRSATDAGEEALRLLRRHVDQVAAAGEADEETDRALWEAVAAYGDALDEVADELDEDEEQPEPDELRFTVRARYDYAVVDEKEFLAAGRGVAGAVAALLQRAGGKPIPALEVGSLETGSGLVTVHLNDEPLTAVDFDDADEPTDLLLVDPEENLQFVLDEPVYDSRAEAEAAARRDGER